MTHNPEKNPFTKEDPLQSWFEQDKFYQNSKHEDLGKLKVKINYKSSIFMSIQDSYLKTINAITKHAILATLIMLVAIGGVGASAAQLIAPEEYKPSTIIQKTFNPKDFEKNKQADKNPYTALIPDDSNDVTKLEKCDLAVKYPKQIVNTPIKIFNDYNLDSAYSSFRIYDGYQFTEKYSNQGSKIEAEKNVNLDGLYIDCVDSQYKRAKLIETGVNIENYTESISKSELQQKTGWFVTQADISNIRFWDNGYGLISLNFDFKDQTYNMSFIDEDARTNARKEQAKIDPQSLQAVIDTGYFQRPGIFGNQVQIQFNSLVENQANTQVVDGKNNSNNSKLSANESILADELFEVQGGGQMRFNDDSGGGLELKRLKDGKIFVVMNSLFDSKGITLNYGQKVRLSGSYIAITKDVDFAGGSGNAELIITSLSKISVEDKSNSLTKITIAPKNIQGMGTVISSKCDPVIYSIDVTPGIVSYSKNLIVHNNPTGSALFDRVTMNITSKSLDLSPDKLTSLRALPNYLNTGIGDSNHPIEYNFNNICTIGGTGRVEFSNKKITYPGTSVARMAVAGYGQELPGYVVVEVYAKKDDNYILLTKPIASIFDANTIPDYTKTNFGNCQTNPNCVQDYVKNNPQIQTKIDQATNELLRAFAL